MKVKRYTVCSECGKGIDLWLNICKECWEKRKED